MNPRHAAPLLSGFGFFLLSHPAWAWFAEGHKIVAIIAADRLTPSSRSHAAQILNVPADIGSVEQAMAAASIRRTPNFERRIDPQHRGITSTSAFKILSRICRCGARTEIASRRKSTSIRVAFTKGITTTGKQPATSPF
jgi:hypothetical protein